MAPELQLTSPQITRQQEMPTDGEVYIAAAGSALAAGQPVVLTFKGLPHHSPVPQWTALGLAGAIVLFGLLAPRRLDPAATRLAARARLTTRREKLLQELVRLDADERRGKIGGAVYVTRREELVLALERVFGALDDTNEFVPAEGPGASA